MIDFDALCLAPAMGAFARPVVVFPKASRPGEPSFTARGVWSSKPIDVSLLDDRVLSSQVHTLGIRATEFEVGQGDEIEIPAHLSLPAIGRCLVDDVDGDGQGGLVVTLKVIGS